MRITIPRTDTSKRSGAFPSSGKSRTKAFDVLRGFAFLGFVPLIIQDLSLVAVKPGISAEDNVLMGLDGVIWISLTLFFDETFVALLSLLFGAGLIVMWQTLPPNDRVFGDGVKTTTLMDKFRYLRRGRCAAPIMARRVIGLFFASLILHFAFGVSLHLFIWALSGFALIALRHSPPTRLVHIGLTALFSQCALLILAAYGTPYFDWPLIQTYAEQDAGLPFNNNASLLAAAKGPWIEGILWRLQSDTLIMDGLFLAQNGLRILALCLLGGAFAHWRVLEASLPTSRYAQWLAVSALVGLPIGVLGILENISHSWHPLFTLGLGAQYDIWSSLTIAGGLAAGTMIACRYQWFSAITSRFAAIGRLALTHGLITVLVSIFLFQGIGLSWAGETDRIDNMQITAVLWAFQITASKSWLRYFHFGPAEWLLRQVSYRMSLPFANLKRLMA